MKFILSFIFFLSIVLSASENSLVDFNKEMEELYPLVELSLVQRSLSPGFFKALENELNEKGYLNALAVRNIKVQTQGQVELREQLLSKAVMFEGWRTDENIEGRTRLKGVMFSLSAAIVLYDNYLFNLSLFQNDSHLRRIINAPDSEYHLQSRELLLTTKEYTSIGNYIRMKKAIMFYQNGLNKGYVFDEHMIYLQDLIEKSPSYRALEDKNFFHVVSQKLHFYGKTSVDELGLVGKEGVNLLSEVFGNGVGLVSTRKGLMYKKPKLENELRATLISGDILLEKTPFRLTDKLIPGYWGHAAIWIGNKRELIDLGIWENALIKPYHKQIESGQQVIEAIRPGVELSSLSHFLNIDDMAVLRDESVSNKQRSKVILRAFAQLGKAYDFNFDVETSDKIVCSELVYACYTDIRWPTDKTMGRYTVSPDHIAKKTESRRLKVISLYHKGKEVKEPELLWKKMLADAL